MRKFIFFQFSIINTLGTVTNEKRPYRNAGSITNGNPCGIDPYNYQADIPCGDGGTNPSMGLMNAYNQLNWLGGYAGRKGASKIVILETDGVANQRINGTLSDLGSGRKHWTSISNGGSAPFPMNGHPQALDPAITLAWLIAQDATGSKPWPTFPPYTNGGGLATAGQPTKWSGVPAGAPGFSTARNPARVHALAFGEIFESTSTTPMKPRSLEFLRNVQLVGNTLPPGATSIEDYKIITGTYTERIAKIREAMERIFQGGIQVALIE
jgi:hypothetical protein